MRILALNTILALAVAPLCAQNSGPHAGGDTAITAASSAAGAPGASAASKSSAAPDSPAKISVVGDDKAIDPGSVALPMAIMRNNSLGIPQGAPIIVRLNQAIDSGHAHNGDILRGTLVKAVKDAPAGSPVELTVVTAAAAGQMTSAGELSVQVTRINGSPVLSEVVTAVGRDGKRATPDADPARGTEAELTPDKPLTLPAA